MSAPQPPLSPVVRHYRFDAEYLADAANMEAAGWRLAAVRREPDYTIVATYTYAMTMYPAPIQPFAPVAPSSASRYIGVALGVRVALVFLLLVCATALGMYRSVLLTSPYIPPTSATYNPNADSIAAICATMTASASATAQPTPTSSATDLTGPTLGGMYDAFGALFGCEGSSGTWYDVNFHGQIVTIEAGGSQNISQSGLASSDGSNRVFSVTVSWYHSPTPSLATMRATIAHFFPPDNVSLGANTHVTPTEYLYRSAPLAAMFDPGAFVNSANQAVTPGTFSEVCDNTRCTVQIGDWDWV